jgi:hypothetical protein
MPEPSRSTGAQPSAEAAARSAHTAEDWLAVAARFNAEQGDHSQSSPLFAALSLAVEQRDEGRAAGRDEALREVVVFVRDVVAPAATSQSGADAICAAADAIEAAFPTIREKP